MFGDGPCVKVCCGPRCGAEPMHRAVYAAVEASCPMTVSVVPTGCRGHCGDGVTVVLTDGKVAKLRDPIDAAALVRDQEKGTVSGRESAVGGETVPRISVSEETDTPWPDRSIT